MSKPPEDVLRGLSKEEHARARVSEPPEAVLQGLSGEERERILVWWGSLSPEIRAEVKRMWDARAEDLALQGPLPSGERVWQPLPIKLVGIFVDEEDRIERRTARQQLFDYVANHEEILFFLEKRTFHICRAHPGARALIQKGFIPASFVCPAKEDACPMRRILAVCPTKSVALEVVPAL